MSNIVKARTILSTLLNEGDLSPAAKRRIHRALALMTREPAVRRTKPHSVPITDSMRRKIHRLAHNNPSMTIYDIAQVVGLRNSGRVSEVLNDKR